MFSESKITENHCMTNDFCKEFAKHIQPENFFPFTSVQRTLTAAGTSN